MAWRIAAVAAAIIFLVGISLGLAGWIFVKTREPEPWVNRLTKPTREQEMEQSKTKEPPKTE
jgi:hypothetical protein